MEYDNVNIIYLRYFNECSVLFECSFKGEEDTGDDDNSGGDGVDGDGVSQDLSTSCSTQHPACSSRLTVTSPLKTQTQIHTERFLSSKGTITSTSALPAATSRIRYRKGHFRLSTSVSSILDRCRRRCILAADFFRCTRYNLLRFRRRDFQ